MDVCLFVLVVFSGLIVRTNSSKRSLEGLFERKLKILVSFNSNEKDCGTGKWRFVAILWRQTGILLKRVASCY